jgi:hypothetical protein
LRKCEESQDRVTDCGECNGTRMYKSNRRPPRCVALYTDVWFTLTVTVGYCIITTGIDVLGGGEGGGAAGSGREEG